MPITVKCVFFNCDSIISNCIFLCVSFSNIILWRKTREKEVERELNRMCVAQEMVTAVMKLKDTFSLEGKLCKPRQCIKKQRYHFSNKGLYSQSYGFPSSHVQIWQLDHIEGWVPKNWCFQIVVLDNTLVSPLDSKEIKPVNPKGNQPWFFVGRTDAEAEAPKLWPPDVKSWRIGKDPDAGKDWRQEEKVEWQRVRWLNGIANSMDMCLSRLQEMVKHRETWWAAVHGVAEPDMTEWLSSNIGLRDWRVQGKGIRSRGLWDGGKVSEDEYHRSSSLMESTFKGAERRSCSEALRSDSQRKVNSGFRSSSSTLN